MYSSAAISGELGQHEHHEPDGEPVVNDPRFIIYEKVRRIASALEEIYYFIFPIQDSHEFYHSVADSERAKCKFAGSLLVVIGLGLTKSSILVFYMKIFYNKKTFRIVAQMMLGGVVVWTLTFFFVKLFVCFPVTPIVEAFYGHHCPMNALTMWYASCITDIVVDVSILVMPIPVVLKMRLPTKQKIGVLGMFLLGAMQVYACI